MNICCLLLHRQRNMGRAQARHYQISHPTDSSRKWAISWMGEHGRQPGPGLEPSGPTCEQQILLLEILLLQMSGLIVAGFLLWIELWWGRTPPSRAGGLPSKARQRDFNKPVLGNIAALS